MEFLSVEFIKEIAEKYGYIAVFLGILLENLGIPLPGETITIVGGFLAGSGELNYWLVLASAASGAFIGGICGYFIGKSGGWPLLLKVGGFFRVSESKLGEIKDKFSENAVKAIFVGRFLARAVTWATVMTGLTFGLGKFVSLEQLVAWVSQFAVLALLIVVTVTVVPIWLESRQAKIEE
jgi:membrane protein DedA with SNARE-associated domain